MVDNVTATSRVLPGQHSDKQAMSVQKFNNPTQDPNQLSPQDFAASPPSLQTPRALAHPKTTTAAKMEKRKRQNTPSAASPEATEQPCKIIGATTRRRQTHKPPYPYPGIIAVAIWYSTRHSLTLDGIAERLRILFPTMAQLGRKNWLQSMKVHLLQQPAFYRVTDASGEDEWRVNMMRLEPTAFLRLSSRRSRAGVKEYHPNLLKQLNLPPLDPKEVLAFLDQDTHNLSAMDTNHARVDISLQPPKISQTALGGKDALNHQTTNQQNETRASDNLHAAMGISGQGSSSLWKSSAPPPLYHGQFIPGPNDSYYDANISTKYYSGNAAQRHPWVTSSTFSQHPWHTDPLAPVTSMGYWPASSLNALHHFYQQSNAGAHVYIPNTSAPNNHNAFSQSPVSFSSAGNAAFQDVTASLNSQGPAFVGGYNMQQQYFGNTPTCGQNNKKYWDMNLAQH